MAIDFTPTQTPAGTSDGDISFTPSGQAATQQPDTGSGNYILDAAKSLGLGALNLVDKNPISSAITGLSAMPVQGIAKMMGQPDPYATPLPGVDNGAPFGTETSDQDPKQYAEKQAGNALTLGSLFLPATEGADLLTGGKGVIGATGRIAANAGVGATQGFAGGMQKGESADQLKWSTATGAALGGILSSAGEGASGLMGKWAQKSGTSQLTAMKDKLRTLSSSYAENSTPTTNPIKTLEQNSLIKDLRVIDGKVNTDLLTNPEGTGSLDDLIDQQQEAGMKAVKQMTKDAAAAAPKPTQPLLLGPATGRVENATPIKMAGSSYTLPEGMLPEVKVKPLSRFDTTAPDINVTPKSTMGMPSRDAAVIPSGAGSLAKFKDEVISSIKNNSHIKATGKVTKVLAEVEKRFEDFENSYGAQMPYDDMNAVRIAMNKEWDPENYDASRAIGNAARKILYNVPGMGVALKSAMRNEQELINAKSFIMALNTRAVKGGQLGKYIADAVGATVGASVGATIPYAGPFMGAAAGAYFTNKAAGLLQDRYFNPMLAEGAKDFLPLMPKLGAARKVVQGALIPQASSQVGAN